jgi:hypothetical protein
MSRATDPRIPWTSVVFGYGPMLPLVAGAFGTWFMAPDWKVAAIRLSIVWGAIILVYIAGVRRGFGMAEDRASTAVEVVTSMGYFILGGLALVVPAVPTALALLIVGYTLAAVLDRRAALRLDAPAHFARLRPPQLLIGTAALVAIWAWAVDIGGVA